MLQMINSEHIKEIIFENCYQIYEWQNKEKVLKYFLREKKKIKYFLNTNKYIKFNEKYTIKYEDIIFEKNEKKKEKDIEIILY